jgi:hypothetical protein
MLSLGCIDRASAKYTSSDRILGAPDRESAKTICSQNYRGSANYDAVFDFHQSFDSVHFPFIFVCWLFPVIARFMAEEGSATHAEMFGSFFVCSRGCPIAWQRRRTPFATWCRDANQIAAESTNNRGILIAGRKNWMMYDGFADAFQNSVFANADNRR